MKKIVKIFIVFVSLIILNCTYSIVSNGVNDQTILEDDGQGQGTTDGLGLGSLSEYVGGNIKSDQYIKKVNVIIYLIQVVGSAISVIGILVIGIKYMISSVEEKAEYKKTIFRYVLGCVFVFSISNLLRIVYSIAINI